MREWRAACPVAQSNWAQPPFGACNAATAPLFREIVLGLQTFRLWCSSALSVTQDRIGSPAQLVSTLELPTVRGSAL